MPKPVDQLVAIKVKNHYYDHMRDNTWAENRMNQIWRDNFSDVSQENKVKIKFGRRARTRLGSIRRTQKRMLNKDNADSEIMLTGYFKDEIIPEYIIDLTIAHELCHYAHGFSSPLPQLFKYPHQGGLVDKELVRRGFGPKLLDQKKWLKEVWPQIIGVQKRKRRKRRPKAVKISNIFQILFN